MTYKLCVDSNNPPTDALILIELINTINKEKVEVTWYKEWEGDGNVKLLNCHNKLLGERSYDVSRYFARTSNPDLYGGTKLHERTEVDHWLSIAIGPLGSTLFKQEILSYLDRILMTNTWLVSKKLTLADIHVFVILLENNFIEKYGEQFINISRWYELILSLPAVVQALAAIKINRTTTPTVLQSEKAVVKQPTTRKQEGKFIDLPGAEMGKVVVRFPPEASGYLHIGHAKAALLNQYYAQAFQGQLIMRFDDTNPAKENVIFEQAILEDLELLQIKPDRFTHSSDYFDLMLDYCTKLIKEGKAYVDDTPANVMKEQRDQKLKSKNRDTSVEKNLQLWEEMQNGTAKGQECCVRAKIDYQSMNGCLRDPTIYRCKPEPHPRTGTKYKVYPTYDFACPIVDAIENVTHTLRTTEYHDRDAQFYWIIDALDLRRPHIWEYSRLNMTNTVLSKRKLTWFVTKGLVDGWDDPRFPTVRGILRRGMTVEGLRQFIIAQGSSRSVVFMEWDKIWAFNKKVIDPIAIRYTALDQDNIIPVKILDAKEEWLVVQNHPKDVSIGTKRILTSQTIYIEKDDAEALVEGQNATFINWGNIMIKKIEIENGKVKSVLGTLNLENKDYKNTLKITWLALPSIKNSDRVKDGDLIPVYTVYFDNIINKPVLKNDEDFKDFVAQNTRREVLMLGEPELKRVKQHEIIQLQRKGFFRCDVPYGDVSPFSSRKQPIILFHIPDGHSAPAKAMSTATSTRTPNQVVTDTNNKTNSADAIHEKIVVQGEKVRRLKSEKADKMIIDTEIKLLLSLKAEYKTCTGNEWKPEMAPTVSLKKLKASNDTPDLQGEITQQEAKIKQLQDKINQEMSHLANLKTAYKSKTGSEWVSGGSLVIDECKEQKKNTDKLSNEIEKQGNKVRQLKSSKTDKSVIDQEVKILLALKAEYKAVTAQEWKPSANLNKTKSLDEFSKTTVDKNKTSEQNVIEKVIINKEQISNQIQAQGNKVRQLKNSNAAKDTILDEVRKLQKLKADYTLVTGEEWKTPSAPAKAKPAEELDDATINTNKLYNAIQKQDDKVRELKYSETDKKIINEEVKILLSLKNDYKTITGQEWKSANSAESTPKKKKKQHSPEKEKRGEKQVVKSEKNTDADTSKTGTRLGLEAKKEDNFFDWYSQIITKAGMIEYYDVSGCYILRPWSFAIWNIIKEYISKEISQMGVQECYFPIFVTRSVLEKEKTHIADFAPEVAWVTKCGDSDLAEPIAIRPTSETVMYPAYAKWLRSDTELPLRLNQWNNVVRWEFKDPKPFLRTREFLWQEGHTAFATKSEADKEVLTILNMYARVYEDLLAVPVIKGRKTEKEKFAGGDYTTTVEAFIPTSGRGIQGATSHHLGQNFSKMFNIQVEGVSGSDEKTFVYQNSWGLTTRSIGVMIMVHGDDKGLVLPPNVASIQAVIVPCGINAKQKETISKECHILMNELSKDSTLRLKGDYRDNRTSGWKYNHWELKGVPVRIELGPKDLQKNQVTLVRRDTSERVVAARADALTVLQKLLTDIQSDMLARAKAELYKHIKQTTDWNEFCSELNKKNMLLSPFCGEPPCEDNIKTDSAREDTGTEPGTLSMGAKSLCIPFDQPTSGTPITEQKCIYPNCQNKPKFYTLFGRSY